MAAGRCLGLLALRHRQCGDLAAWRWVPKGVFQAFAADGGESEEDVQGIERCVTLIAVFRSWVRVAEKRFLGSLASAPHHKERLEAKGQSV